MIVRPAPQLVVDVSAEVVARVAPKNLPYFPADAGEFTSARRARRDPLSSGIESVEAVFGLIVLFVGNQLLEYLLGQAFAATGGWVGRVWGRRREVSSLAGVGPLDEARRSELRDIAIASAASKGVDPERSAAIADAFLTELSRRTGGDPPR
ncbi:MULTISPECIES: hypothetical protein [Catenuloplanes]|uniref:Uncharacterized protein n=1 Tax=Catenuloplanes niger TaxID=587534 RepID=A0AAE4CTB9_9ACTN|nr:hypothetical protein [Catenuloplanes niger]MDR7320564.1 hypothetical protein [Catenuloplanes niger]